MVEVCCDLQVDVNGEETFLVDEKILSSYSGRLRKLFGKSVGSTKSLKVIFQGFPGGPESFELLLRFCYNNGKMEITHSNTCILHSAAHFMEMNEPVSGSDNLMELTRKSLNDMGYWTWSELLAALKQCQDLQLATSTPVIVKKCLDSLVGRLTLSIEPSPCPSSSSSDSSGFRLSSDTKSSEGLKNSFTRITWWFEDLLFVDLKFLDLVIKTMISHKFDHGVVSKFLFYYQKSKFQTATPHEKHEIIETVIDLLHYLDRTFVPCKSLFGILRVASGLNMSKFTRNKLENMIGSQLDQATLDNLLVPSPSGINYLYDVNLVLRLVRAFLRGGTETSMLQFSKVARLMDLYIVEVAADPCLKPSKFLALAMALPDSARDSYDEIYRAMDMYIEVHVGLSEDEKLKLCCALNYGKLSADICKHLSQNAKFPPKTAIKALMSQKLKLKSLLHASKDSGQLVDSPCSIPENQREGSDSSSEQIVLYAGELDPPSENEKLRAHLQGMQWRVMELEKVCRRMQSQMAKILKSKAASHSNSRSLPKLCS